MMLKLQYHILTDLLIYSNIIIIITDETEAHFVVDFLFYVSSSEYGK